MKRLLFLLIMALLTGGLAARAQSGYTWQFDSARAVTELNGPARHQASFPWLSVDGRRLYYVDSNRRPVVAERSGPGQRFGLPRLVRGLPTQASAPRYSDDELTVWYTILPGSFLSIATRLTDTAAFSPAHPLGWDPTAPSFNFSLYQGRFYSPSFSQNGQELYLTWESGMDGSGIAYFRTVGPDSVAYVRPLFWSTGWHSGTLTPTTTQLIDNDLRMLVSSDSAVRFHNTYILDRPTAADTFSLPHRLVLPPHGATNHDSQAMYRGSCNAMVVVQALAFYADGGDIWLMEGITRPLGLPTGLAVPTFTLAPNPAHRTVRLTNAPAGPVTLLDAVGRTVRTAAIAPGQAEATLSVEGLPAGLYVVRAGQQARRLVVE